jgi:hypothetical protein
MISSDVPKVADIYSSMYPYNHLDGTKIKNFTDTVDKCLRAQELLLENNKQFVGFDCLVVALRFLQDSCCLDLNGCLFLDCLSFGGSSSIYAKCFGFKATHGIELSEKSYQCIQRSIATMATELIFAANSCTFVVGSMQDYFQPDADVVYVDFATFCRDSMLDEGVLMLTVFALLRQLTPGSYAIIITLSMNLTTSKCRELGAGILHCVFQQEIARKEYGDERCKLWILKVFS